MLSLKVCLPGSYTWNCNRDFYLSQMQTNFVNKDSSCKTKEN